jgi:hypothetical protein
MRFPIILTVFLFFCGAAFGAELFYGGDLFDLRFPAGAKVMVPFDVEITAKTPQAPDKIKLSFEMKAMYMGEFKFEAEKKDGVYRVKGVTLPRCMSGDKKWVLVIDYGGGKQEVNFELD